MTPKTCANCGYHKDYHDIERDTSMGRQACEKFIPQNHSLKGLESGIHSRKRTREFNSHCSEDTEPEGRAVKHSTSGSDDASSLSDKIKDLKYDLRYSLYLDSNTENVYYNKGWDDASRKLREIINEKIDNILLGKGGKEMKTDTKEDIMEKERIMDEEIEEEKSLGVR